MPVGSRIDTSNISLGIGTLEIGEYVNDSFVSYRDSGLIRTTVTATWTREIHNLETGRPLRIVKQEVIREGFMIAFRLAEITVANIRMAIAGGIASSGVAPVFMDGTANAPEGDQLSDSASAVLAANTHILAMGGQESVNYSALRFTHLKVDGYRQIIEVFKAAPSGTLALPYNEADWNETEVTFTAITDFSRPRGKQLSQFVDERP